MIQHATTDYVAHHVQQTVPDSAYIDTRLWRRGRNAIAFVALICWVAAIAGFFIDPARFYQSYLTAFLFTVFIPLGATFFVMVQYLTGSAWSVPMRRIAENMMMTIPAGLVLIIPVLFGVHDLYHWSHADVVAKDALQRAKASYLNQNWFLYRALIFFGLWTLWAWRIYKHSTRQDRDGSLEHMHAISRWSAPGLLMLVVTVTLASFDWSMSLDPHWYSTIFGLYCFSGGALAFVAAWTLICRFLRDKGVLANTINIEHYHDLGKWMFALVIFWAYIAFSQYLLIWYANIPEETIWYFHRFEGSWGVLSFVLLFGHFIIPFLVLLPRAAKRNLRVLTGMAIWLLVMQYLDFYWQVMPTFYAAGVAPHWLNLACLGAVGSVFALVFWSRMKAHALMPVGDPRFEQGIRFQNL
jgi:hypothetical protein